MFTAAPLGSLRTQLCGAVGSWLSNSTANSTLAGPVSSLGSKPVVAAPVGAAISTTRAEGLPEGSSDAAPDGLGSAEAGALGSPEAAADVTGVADAAGAYVQPGPPVLAPHAARVSEKRMATAVERRRIRMGPQRAGLAARKGADRSPESTVATRIVRCGSAPTGRGQARGLGQPEPDRHGCRLDPSGHPELGEDVADVDPDGLLADE